ncbi:MAG TPA: hypothetical protein PLQ76_03730, partial [bacterium]|nr:hypothetical protein [bacterium]
MNKTQKSILFILLAAGIFARAYRLGDKPLWIDEGINLKVAAFKSVAEIRAFYVNEQHTALPNIIDHYWIRTAGKSMAALHSESLMWSVAALLLFAALAAGNLTPSAALGATAVFSIGAFQPEYAQMLRYPALSQFAACVWMLGFFRYVRHGGAAALTLFAAGAVLSVFAHIYGLFILAASAVFVLAARKKLGGRFLPLLAAHLVPAAAIAPKIVMYKTSGLTSLLHPAPPLAIIKEIALHPVSGQAHVMFNFCMGAVYDLTNFPKLATIAVFAVFGVAAVAAATRGDNRFAACWCAWVIAAATTAGWIVSNLTS